MDRDCARGTWMMSPSAIVVDLAVESTAAGLAFPGAHPAQLEPSATCRPARTSRAQRTRATPPQRHRRRCMATARPATTAQERQGGRLEPRCSGSSHAPPTLPPQLPALACRRAGSHSCPPSRSAGRSQRPCPEQARGARAPSSRVVSSTQRRPSISQPPAGGPPEVTGKAPSERPSNPTRRSSLRLRLKSQCT